MTIVDLAPLGVAFRDPAVVVVVHAGSNDLAELKARHGIGFTSVFDTSIAARFLGVRALGLDALLTTYLEVELPPSRQRDDWSARPLSPEQEAYAASDVVHLFALKARLTEALIEIGRLAWVEEECRALAELPAPDRTVDPEAYLSLKGVRDLSPRALAMLRELSQMREQLAISLDRPPFKVLAPDTLVALAQAAPQDDVELGRISGITPRVSARFGRDILAAIARGRATPEPALPVLSRPMRSSVPAVVSRRAEALRRWRVGAVERYGLEPGALLPNRLISVLAEAGPRDREALAAIDGLRQWRIATFGDELLDVVRSA